VVRVAAEGQWPMFGLVDIRQTEPEYDVMTNHIMMPRFLGWITPNADTAIDARQFPGLGQTIGAHGARISLRQGKMSVANTGNPPAVLALPDGRPHPDGPFDNMPWRIPPHEVTEHITAIEAAGGASPEFSVGDIKFKLVGRDPSGYLVVESTDAQGGRRNMFVYQSRSEGSWRTSQGQEKATYRGREIVRVLKGAETLNEQDSQYTQDTQLHPDFIRGIENILDTEADEAEVPTTHVLDGAFTEQQVDYLQRDFANQTRTLALTQGLDAQLHRLRAGHFSSQDVAKLAGSSKPARMSAAVRQEIAELNKALQSANIIPDFSQGTDRISMETHPVLGHYAKEVYTKVTDGRVVEWHMSRDLQGHVWIERIRFQDSPASAYGADRFVPYSGALTSKPYEYEQQAEGLPAEWRTESGTTGYDDISGFLDRLLPIQRYRETAITPGRTFHSVVTPQGLVRF